MRLPALTLYRPLGYLIVKPLLTLLLRPQVRGRRRIPRRGGCILVANHESPIDPFVLGRASHRVVRYVAKAELFRYPLLRPFLRAPIALVNTEKVLPPRRLKIGLPRVRIVIGEPIRVPQTPATREAVVR